MHHLTDALDAASLELRRVVKPDGLAVFSEPVLRSKLITGLRKVFPKNDEITEDERQLNDTDFAKFLDAFECCIENFDILSRLSKLLSRGPLESAPRPIAWIILGLARLDRISWCYLLRNASQAIRLS